MSLTTVRGSMHDILWSFSQGESDVLVLVGFVQLFTKLHAGLCDLGSARE